MITSALVLAVVILLIGCAWTTRRYRRAYQALRVARRSQLVAYALPATADRRDAA